MKRGAQTAAAVIAGYLLGRTKKMRLALMIAAAGATGRHGTNATGLLKSGLSQLGESAELGKLTGGVKEELLGAARAAATRAATSRIESLTERLAGDTGGSEDTGDAGEEEPDSTEQGREPEETSEATETPEESAEPDRRPGTRRRARRSADDEESEPALPRPRRRPSSGEGNRRPVRRRREQAEDTDRAAATDDGETEARPRTRARSSAGRSPVRRSGR